MLPEENEMAIICICTDTYMRTPLSLYIHIFNCALFQENKLAIMHQLQWSNIIDGILTPFQHVAWVQTPSTIMIIIMSMSICSL